MFLDVENFTSVQKFLSIIDSNIDYVINCIGLLVKDCQDRPDLAVQINSWFPQFLAQQLQNTAVKIIHISTDCVFDGSKGQYTETDLPTETNYYGKSKSLGEICNKKDITFRCSIVGPELKNGSGLLNWFRFQSGFIVKGWTNAYWNGMTTLQLAKCINSYITKGAEVAGIYHLADNNLSISKYDLLRLFDQVYYHKKTIEPVQLDQTIDKTIIDTRCCFDWAIPDLQNQLEELRDFYPLAHV
jgi:dTDP-4-dehydrorhamnose reductase